jgi:cobalt/nickel transport system ATP-binding protein
LSITINSLANRSCKNITFKLRNKEKIAIIGKNGVGKTTLLKSILGLVEYTGSINILDKDITSQSEHKDANEHIGFLFQDSDDSFIAPTVLEEIAFNLMNKIESKEISQSKATELLQEFGIEHLKSAIPMNLSGGQKRLVSICATLVDNPKILLLDEPSNHLDTNSIDLVQQKLREYDGAMVIVAHDIEFTKAIVDRFYEMSQDGIQEVIL